MSKLLLLLILMTGAQSGHANTVSDDINRLVSHQSGVNHHTQAKNDFNHINQQYAFVFFYRASCTHCQRMAPVLRAFSKDYGFHVYAYSDQNEKLPSFPNTLPLNESIATPFFNTPNFVLPSLFLINTETMKAFLIDQGEESLIDLYAQVQQFEEMLNRGKASNEI